MSWHPLSDNPIVFSQLIEGVVVFRHNLGVKGPRAQSLYGRLTHYRSLPLRHFFSLVFLKQRTTYGINYCLKNSWGAAHGLV